VNRRQHRLIDVENCRFTMSPIGGAIPNQNYLSSSETGSC
jgi:hypothetical protein